MKIYLAHGRGGSQHSKEIFHLARTAKRAGHTTHCINDTDSEDPELRSARLTALVAAEAAPVVLMGFSMGGYTAMLAAAAHPEKVRGLFLVAPALYAPRYQVKSYPTISPTEIVHGWDDDVILYEHSLRYARDPDATLHLVDAGHFFYAPHELAQLRHTFSGFLSQFTA